MAAVAAAAASGVRLEGAGRGGRQQQRRRSTRDGVSRETYRRRAAAQAAASPLPGTCPSLFSHSIVSDPCPYPARQGTLLALRPRSWCWTTVVMGCAPPASGSSLCGGPAGRNGGVTEGDTRGFAAAAGACGAVGAAIVRQRFVQYRSHGPRDQTTRRGGSAAAERGTLPGAQALGSVPAGLVRVSHRGDSAVGYALDRFVDVDVRTVVVRCCKCNEIARNQHGGARRAR